MRGCLFGAVGFEVLKLVGTYFVGHTMRNPVYASFAVIVGLLIWINLVSRFILFTAAWTATRRVILSADAPPAEAAD
jgi:membrane protein